MRTNYKGILSLIKKNFTFEDIIDSPSIGKVIVFEQGISHLRLVLVDGNSQSEAQGIHITYFETKEELERSLVDAVETALKDNFGTIFIHQKPKPSPEVKERLSKAAKGWLTSKNVEQSQLSYSLKKRYLTAEKSAEIIDQMTEEQVAVLIALVSSAYSGGCASTREFFSRIRQEEKNETKGA